MVKCCISLQEMLLCSFSITKPQIYYKWAKESKESNSDIHVYAKIPSRICSVFLIFSLCFYMEILMQRAAQRRYLLILDRRIAVSVYSRPPIIHKNVQLDDLFDMEKYLYKIYLKVYLVKYLKIMNAWFLDDKEMRIKRWIRI